MEKYELVKQSKLQTNTQRKLEEEKEEQLNNQKNLEQQVKQKLHAKQLAQQLEEQINTKKQKNLEPGINTQFHGYPNRPQTSSQDIRIRKVKKAKIIRKMLDLQQEIKKQKESLTEDELSCKNNYLQAQLNLVHYLALQKLQQEYNKFYESGQKEVDDQEFIIQENDEETDEDIQEEQEDQGKSQCQQEIDQQIQQSKVQVDQITQLKQYNTPTHSFTSDLKPHPPHLFQNHNFQKDSKTNQYLKREHRILKRMKELDENLKEQNMLRQSQPLIEIAKVQHLAGSQRYNRLIPAYKLAKSSRPSTVYSKEKQISQLRSIQSSRQQDKFEQQGQVEGYKVELQDQITPSLQKLTQNVAKYKVADVYLNHYYKDRRDTSHLII